MTRVLGLDFETTGIDVTKERITEIGTVLWEVEEKRPVMTFSVFCYDEGIAEKCADPAITEMMKRVSGITPEMLKEFGTPIKGNLELLDRFCTQHQVDYIVAHNGNNYDRPLLMAEMARNGVVAPQLAALPWIDTRTDIPFPTEPDSRKLKHLALDSGFINPFAHRAAFDVLTMLRVMSGYDFESILSHRARKDIIIRLLVPHPKQDAGKGKDFAKSKGFRWQEVNYKQFPLCWVKLVKEDELPKIKEQMSPYEVVIL